MELTEQMLRDAHRAGFYAGKKYQKHAGDNSPYHKRLFDFSQVRAKYGFGPRAKK